MPVKPGPRWAQRLARQSRPVFHALVGEAQRRCLNVILDISEPPAWTDALIKNAALSKRDAPGRIRSPVDWTDAAPLGYPNPELRQCSQCWSIGQVFDLDGSRCHVAGMVPVSFWEQAREVLDTLKPGFILLAEWHDAGEEFLVAIHFQGALSYGTNDIALGEVLASPTALKKSMPGGQLPDLGLDTLG